MKAQIINKKVMLNATVIRCGDKNVDTIVFESPLFYRDLSLENLHVYIKTENRLGAKCKSVLKIEKEQDKLLIEWPITEEATAVNGILLCQLSFESDDGEVVLNTNVFEILIENSIKDGLPKVSIEYNHIIQLQNELQRALKEDVLKKGDNISALNNDANYISSEKVSSDYLSKTQANSDYLTKSQASTTYATKEKVNADYLTKAQASSTYLTSENAAKTYLTSEKAGLDYLSKAQAEESYATNEKVSADYLTKAQASSTYLTSEDASKTYLTSAKANTDYLSKTQANSDYLTKSQANADYLTKSQASTTYATNEKVSADYLTKAQASSTYLTSEDASKTYLTSAKASTDYLSKSQANSDYLTKSQANTDYLTKSQASTTYATNEKVSADYLTKAQASSTYLTSENASKTYLTSEKAGLDYLSKAQAEESYATKEEVDNLSFGLFFENYASFLQAANSKQTQPKVNCIIRIKSGEVCDLCVSAVKDNFVTCSLSEEEFANELLVSGSVQAGYCEYLPAKALAYSDSLPDVDASDAGKYLSVNDNGEWQAGILEGYTGEVEGGAIVQTLKGVDVQEIYSGEALQDGEYTVTPVTFVKSDETRDQINVYAQNGSHIVSAETSQPTVEGEYTITPVTFNQNDGSKFSFQIKAKQGRGISSVQADNGVLSVTYDDGQSESIGSLYQMANATQLGLVKADVYYISDTMPVRIGTDGKLYTRPGTVYSHTITLKNGDSKCMFNVISARNTTVSNHLLLSQIVPVGYHVATGIINGIAVAAINRKSTGFFMVDINGTETSISYSTSTITDVVRTVTTEVIV